MTAWKKKALYLATSSYLSNQSFAIEAFPSILATTLL
jgi:hypothetical protein